jgi:hypothetical protein
VDLAGQRVEWKGNIYPVNEEQAIILDLLKSRLGKGPMTEKQMVAANPRLEGVHFNRTINGLPQAIRALVKSERGKGRWLELR